MLTFPFCEMVTVVINGGLVYWVNQRPIKGRDFGRAGEGVVCMCVCKA